MIRLAAVSIREFSYNPSAMFARVEHGETIEVTRHGKVIALLTPPSKHKSRIEELIELGLIYPAERKAGDWENMTHIEVPDDADPLALLLEMREHER